MANVVRFSEHDIIRAGRHDFIREALPPGTKVLQRLDDPLTRATLLLVEYDFEWCLNRVNNTFDRFEHEEDCGQDLME